MKIFYITSIVILSLALLIQTLRCNDAQYFSDYWYHQYDYEKCLVYNKKKEIEDLTNTNRKLNDALAKYWKEDPKLAKK